LQRDGGDERDRVHHLVASNAGDALRALSPSAFVRELNRRGVPAFCLRNLRDDAPLDLLRRGLPCAGDPRSHQASEGVDIGTLGRRRVFDSKLTGLSFELAALSGRRRRQANRGRDGAGRTTLLLKGTAHAARFVAWRP